MNKLQDAESLDRAVVQDDREKVLIVGAGKVGRGFEEKIINFGKCKLGLVVDRDSNAVGIKYAKENGVNTASDIPENLDEFSVIIETAGVSGLKEELSKRVNWDKQVFISSRAAWFLENIEKKMVGKFLSKVAKLLDSLTKVKMEAQEAIAKINSVISEITSVVETIRILSINAKIESTRIGVEGAVFKIVASEMENMLDIVISYASKVKNTAEESKTVIYALDEVEKRLKQMLEANKVEPLRGKVLVVGGGRASSAFLDFLKDMDTEIIGVVDKQKNAPGIIKAGEIGVPTADNYDALLPEADLVIELTGSPKVRDDLIEKVDFSRQDLLTSKGAKFVYDFVEMVEQLKKRDVRELLKSFENLSEKMFTFSRNLDAVILEMKDILATTRILAVNAKMEASRFIEGKGQTFKVVAKQMEDTVEDISQQVGNLEEASEVLAYLFDEVKEEMKDIEGAV